MSVSEAKRFAKRVRAQSTAEAKLNDASKAIEELATVIGHMDARLKHVESIIVMIANRR